jgi:hypothetical protein
MPFGVVRNLQEIVFEHRESIREDVFVQIMDSLQCVHHEEANQEVIVEAVMLVMKPANNIEGALRNMGTDVHMTMQTKTKLLSMPYTRYEKYNKRIKAQGWTISDDSTHLRRYTRMVGVDTESIFDRESDDEEECYVEGKLCICTDNIVFLKMTLKSEISKSSLLMCPKKNVHCQTDEQTIQTTVSNIEPEPLISGSSSDEDSLPTRDDEETDIPALYELRLSNPDGEARYDISDAESES